MKIFTLDFETFYSKEYSLLRMTPAEYILDPRFEVIGCAVVTQNGLSTFLEEHQLREFLKRLPAEVTIISHHALFDMCILAWRFGYVPALMIDTLGMSRAWLGYKLGRFSLKKVAEALGIGVKGDTVLRVEGMTKDMIKSIPGLWREYSDYSVNDAELCYGIFRNIMKQGFPPRELYIADMVLRCAVEPTFRLDHNLLHEHLAETLAKKQGLLDRVGLTSRDMLMSNDKFASALRVLGVEPPMKTSITTGLPTYAFSKTDIAFRDLEEHPNPEVQALVAARLGVKTTLEETRAQRLINISNLDWPGEGQARKMPIPLRYGGAHTHRLSGDWKINTQNFTRGGKLRKALVAPDGHKVVVADSSQIEARMVAWLSGCTTLTNAFAAGDDVYSIFATDIFGRHITKADKNERFVGKQGILGLGYGLGWLKFKDRLKTDSLNQTGTAIELTEEEAQRIVGLYRNNYHEVPTEWRVLNSTIPQMTRKDCNIVHGPVVFMHQKVLLPNGLYLYYNDLRYENDEWRFTYGGKSKRLYGGKLLENIIQALARIITMEAGARCQKIFRAVDPSIKLKLQAHDELGFIPPDQHVEFVKQTLLREMCVAPDWAAGLPLAAEAGVGPSYGSAK